MPIELSEAERAKMRAWIGRNERRSPVYPRSEDEFFDDILLSPPDDDEIERVTYWRNASEETRARAVASLLHHIDAIGRYPQDREMFPGFPPMRRLPPET